MNFAAIAFPPIDEVALQLIGAVEIFGYQIGPIAIRWYGLAYLAGFVLGWLYMRRLLSQTALWRSGIPPMKKEQADDFLLWATLGTVIGGRLGFFLFYEPTLLFQNPLVFFVIWKGGMAFHGGLLGVILAIVLFSRVNKIPLLSVGDLAAAAVPFGLFFGRIANFINAEVYGRLTTMPWGVEFPADKLAEGHLYGPRHPTQLYEAVLEGLIMFVLLRYFTHSRFSLKQPGLTAGLFLSAYALSRIGVEFFKEWDTAQFLTTAYFSEGMIYSLPMLGFGAYLIARASQQETASASQAGNHFLQK